MVVHFGDHDENTLLANEKVLDRGVYAFTGHPNNPIFLGFSKFWGFQGASARILTSVLITRVVTVVRILTSTIPTVSTKQKVS